MDKYTEKIKQVQQRAEMLHQRVDELDGHPQHLLTHAFEELNVALEEIHVAEEQLREQNERLAIANSLVEAERKRYQELFDFAPDGYLITDTDGSIIEANRAAVEMLKVPAKFLLGKPLVNFIPPPERRLFRSQLLRLREQPMLKEWELHLQTRQGNTLDVEITVSTVLDGEGRTNHWRWLLRDISFRKQAEAHLRSMQLQNLELEEASRLKSQFITIMSHELRTPMNAILGFAQILLRQTRHQLNPSQISMVERIITSGKHLLALIEDILDYSKLQAGRVGLSLKTFNLEELVIDVTDEVRCLAAQKRLALHISMEIENVEIMSDRDRLRQILINLLSNAIKFTDTGSITIKAQDTEDQIAICIIDTGIGIATADLQHIFQEFRQVNQSITRQQGGTGLGLAIVKQLVNLMGGTITVASKLGEGSSFCIELPRTVKSAEC